MLNRFLQFSAPLPSVAVQFALRFFSDQTVDLVPISWPPITIDTDDPYRLVVRFKSAQRGSYFTRLDTLGGPPFTRFFPRIPTSWNLDFSSDPLIGKKDQDCDLDLRVTSGGMIPAQLSDNVFNGNPTLSTERDGTLVMIGSAEIHTWTYWFPVSAENHTYRLGLQVSGTLSPFPPINVPASMASAPASRTWHFSTNSGRARFAPGPSIRAPERWKWKP
jgi:hypothetical protein